MSIVFKNEFHDDFGTWPLAYIRSGGLDFGEIAAVAREVGDGDDIVYYTAWMKAGDRLAGQAADAKHAGHLASARTFFLKASVAYGTAYHPIFGGPVDPLLLAAFRKQIAAFDQGVALLANPAQPLRIPFESHLMPGYYLPAAGRADEIRPTIVFTNGYDATVTDLYFASAVAASRRGYHALFFDGPGQGEMLYEHGVPIRPDWETVIRSVIDFALSHLPVDPRRIALSGSSLGGYLAPRAASGESRIAACIADPGLWSIAGSFRPFALKLGASAVEANNLGSLGQSVIDRVEEIIRGDRMLRWKLVQRGYWVHGVRTLREYLRAAEEFTLKDRAELIRCPTLLTSAENDPLAAEVQTLYAALRCPKALRQFSAAEGADGHCEMLNRSLLNDRCLDWLDGVIGT